MGQSVPAVVSGAMSVAGIVEWLIRCMVGRSAAKGGGVGTVGRRRAWNITSATRGDASIIPRRDAVSLLIFGEAVPRVPLSVNIPFRFKLVARITRVDVSVVSLGFLAIPLLERQGSTFVRGGSTTWTAMLRDICIICRDGIVARSFAFPRTIEIELLIVVCRIDIVIGNIFVAVDGAMGLPLMR